MIFLIIWDFLSTHALLRLYNTNHTQDLDSLCHMNYKADKMAVGLAQLGMFITF